MQLLGLAAMLLLAPEALLGWRLLSHRPLGEKWRGLMWIAGDAPAPRPLPRPCRASASWPLPTGLGGVAGDALLQLPAMLSARRWRHDAMLWGLAIFFGFATLLAMTMAIGLRVPVRGDEDAERRGPTKRKTRKKTKTRPIAPRPGSA